MSNLLSKISKRLAPIAALTALFLAMEGTWMTTRPAHAGSDPPAAAKPPPARVQPEVGVRTGKKEYTGKVNLNTASEDQLMLLPSIGPSKAERIVTWRKKFGGFRRVADLRKVKGFGYKTLKRLEPLLAIQGDTTLTARP